MNILTLGGASQDIFIHHEDIQTIDLYQKHEKESFLLLQEGSKIEIDMIRYSTGGGATNSAVSFKRLGFNVSSLFKIGDDYRGDAILEDLKKEGVCIEYALVDRPGQTGISFIIPSPHGERTVLAFRGSNTKLCQKELPLDALKKYSYLYITSLNGDSSKILLPVTQRAKLEGVIVANNPGRSQLLAGAPILCQSLPNIDILILNKSEAQQLMISLQGPAKRTLKINVVTKAHANNELPMLLKDEYLVYDAHYFNLVHYFKEIIARGPSIAVVTNGAEGVYVCSQDTIYFHPSFPIKIVNTLGAGDAFGSAFVAGLARYNSIEDAIRYGILNSLSVIAHLDAKTGLMYKDQLDKALEAIDHSLLSIFNISE